MIIRIVAPLYIVFILLIIYLANTGRLRPYLYMVHEIPYADALGHFILMGMLSLFVNCLFKARRLNIGSFQILLGSVLVSIFVVTEECSQLFIASRTFSYLDLTCDFLGIWLFGRWARRVCAK